MQRQGPPKRQREQTGVGAPNNRLHRARHRIVAKKQHVAVWYDREGDFLEVMFEQKEGYFRETVHEQVMEKVDRDGSILGFHVLKVSHLTQPLDIGLVMTDGGQ
jgi:hypothetical protein